MVLGDCTALDVLRVDSAEGTTWASCIAGECWAGRGAREVGLGLPNARASPPRLGDPFPPAPHAAYGYLADVCSGAEGLRWLGPLRYDLVGAAKLLAR